MANRNAPSGFRLANHLAGGTPGRTNAYQIVSGYSSSIFMGDGVVPVNTNKRIARPAADTDRLTGVFNGVNWIAVDGSIKYDRFWLAATVAQTGSVVEATVYDDPNLVFEIQADGAFALADIGAFADLTRGSGNALTGQSTDQLKSSSIGSGASLKILDYVRRPENEIGTNAKLLVSFAIHYLRGAQTAI